MFNHIDIEDPSFYSLMFELAAAEYLLRAVRKHAWSVIINPSHKDDSFTGFPVFVENALSSAATRCHWLAASGFYGRVLGRRVSQPFCDDVVVAPRAAGCGEGLVTSFKSKGRLVSGYCMAIAAIIS